MRGELAVWDSLGLLQQLGVIPPPARERGTLVEVVRSRRAPNATRASFGGSRDASQTHWSAWRVSSSRRESSRGVASFAQNRPKMFVSNPASKLGQARPDKSTKRSTLASATVNQRWT